MSTAQGLLWKVAKENRSHLLFGTIHLPADSIEWNKEFILNRILSFDYYFGEMDLAEASRAPRSHNLLPESNTLCSLLGKKYFQKYRSQIKKSFGVEMQEFNQQYPIFLQHAIDSSICTTQPKSPVDYVLFDHARSNGLDCGGLESHLEQLAILHNFGLDFQLNVVRRIARNPKSYRKKINRILQLYQSQDILELYKLARKQLGGYKRLMIDDRNHRMACRIDALNQDAFISFGAGHLAGKQGILRLLKSKGWDMENC